MVILGSLYIAVTSDNAIGLFPNILDKEPVKIYRRLPRSGFGRYLSEKALSLGGTFLPTHLNDHPQQKAWLEES